jgi:acyl-CoA synthetase (AMP-forming)/AMP-acid ligase II
MLGLNQDYPLLLSSVLEHGAANFGHVPVVSVNRDEHVQLNYRTVARRARRLASGLRQLGFGLDKTAGSLAWNSHRHLELFYAMTGWVPSCTPPTRDYRRRRSVIRSTSPATAHCSSTSTRSRWPKVWHPDSRVCGNTS